MRVQLQKNRAIAFNEFGECALIEKAMFTRLISQLVYRKKMSVKHESTILRDIVSSWPRENLKWVSLSEANK